MTDGPAIRPFDAQTDLDGVYRIVRSVWPMFCEARIETEYFAMQYLVNATSMNVAVSRDLLGFIAYRVCGSEPDTNVRSFSRLTRDLRTALEKTDRKFVEMMDMYSESDRKMFDGFKEDHDCEIILFAVDPTSHGKHIGKGLLNDCMGRLVENGCHRVALMTTNLCNYGFYEHLGFRIGNRIDIDGPSTKMILFVKDLV